MASHISFNCTPNRFAEQIKVTHNVKDFVARQLVGEAQIRIDDFLVVDEDAIVELAAVHQARLLQLLDVPEKAKGSRRRDFFPKASGTVVEVGMLLDAHRLRIIQNIVHRENIRRLDADRLTPLAPDSIRSINS